MTNEVLEQLYRTKAITQPWAHIQIAISALAVKLENWQTALPPVFDFSKKQQDQEFIRHRMSLRLFCYSTLIIISRLCLCRVNRKVPHASEKSRELNRATAAQCVCVAKDMLDLLPNEPNPIELYKVAPWWRLLHHLVQAVTILMLELSFRADRLPQEIEEILQSAKKAVQWLRSMAEVDLAAFRAWRLCEAMLRKVATKVGRPVDGPLEGELPNQALAEGGLPGSGNLFEYSQSTELPYFNSATSTAAENLKENFAPFNSTDSFHQQESFRNGQEAQVYASYDEFFSPPFLNHLPHLMASESPSDFLSMFPSPNQMEGLLSGDLDDPSISYSDQAHS